MSSPSRVDAFLRVYLPVLLLGTVMMPLCAGCSGRTLQADNPVLASSPPRRPRNVAAQTAEAVEAEVGSDVAQASFSDGHAGPLALNEDISGVAATVNGIPILVADVVERFAPQLKAAEQQLSPEEFAKLKRKLIERELPNHIEQAILVDSALSQLAPEQREMVEEQLDTFFTQYLGQLQAQMGATSLVELEGILQREGMTISNLQRSFNNRQLAEQAMGLLAPPEPTVSRREMLEEYQSRLDEFTTPERVRWQQIWISYNKHGGKQQAFGALDEVIAALKHGMPFDQAARQYSDGLKAQDGGQWDWTQRGELSSEEIERMLFELRVGEVGQVVAGENAFQIVRVTERQPITTKTFAEVQGQVGQEIKQRKQKELLDEVLAELKDKAVISTMFDAGEVHVE